MPNAAIATKCAATRLRLTGSSFTSADNLFRTGLFRRYAKVKKRAANPTIPRTVQAPQCPAKPSRPLRIANDALSSQIEMSSNSVEKRIARISRRPKNPQEANQDRSVCAVGRARDCRVEELGNTRKTQEHPAYCCAGTLVKFWIYFRLRPRITSNTPESNATALPADPGPTSGTLAPKATVNAPPNNNIIPTTFCIILQYE
jgi:hypothetical protein